MKRKKLKRIALFNNNNVPNHGNINLYDLNVKRKIKKENHKLPKIPVITRNYKRYKTLKNSFILLLIALNNVNYRNITHNYCNQTMLKMQYCCV